MQIDRYDVEVIFRLVPGAADGLQGMDEENLEPLWRMAVEGAEAVRMADDPHLRDEVRERVATAVRALQYGERLP